MADTEKIVKEWVEVREECSKDRLVLRSADYPMAPARGGRRHLELCRDGAARDRAQSASDAIATMGSGGWSVREDTLQLDLKGWSGDYAIEEVGDDKLVLRRR